MKLLKKVREQKGISQRSLAALANLSYKSVQLLESGRHDPKVSTLESIASVFGYPPHAVEHCLASLFANPADSVAVVSEKIAREGEASWKGWLFNFVDAFRKNKEKQYIASPPVEETPEKVKALLASTVETLCEEGSIKPPWWCRAILPLEKPWFVSGVESLKAMALVETPIHFRERNIFVFKNFLDRR